MAPLYLAGPLLMASAIAKLSPKFRLVFILSAILWLVFDAGFKLAPESWNGILEKIAEASTLLWTLPLAWVLFSGGYERFRRRIE